MIYWEHRTQPIRENSKTRFYWICSWRVHMIAILFTPPNTGLRGVLLFSKFNSDFYDIKWVLRIATLQMLVNVFYYYIWNLVKLEVFLIQNTFIIYIHVEQYTLILKLLKDYLLYVNVFIGFVFLCCYYLYGSCMPHSSIAGFLFLV